MAKLKASVHSDVDMFAPAAKTRVVANGAGTAAGSAAGGNLQSEINSKKLLANNLSRFVC